MNKSKELKTTTDIVKDILQRCPETRNNDNVLYIKVCEVINKVTLGMPFSIVLPNLKSFNLPSIETVGRCRRKIVEEHPELAGNNTVEAYRTLNEEVFRDYAKKHGRA